MKLSAIVLAAGTSSRMGLENKLLLPFSGRPMVRMVVENILAAGFPEIIVVTGHQEALVRKSLQNLPVRFVSNPQYQQGMTSSIQAGVVLAGGKGYLICLADMPFLRSADYQSLAAFFQEKNLADSACICVPAYKGRQGNPVAFSSHYREEILQHAEPEGCKSLLEKHAAHLYAPAIPESTILRDVDTPEAYQNRDMS